MVLRDYSGPYTNSATELRRGANPEHLLDIGYGDDLVKTVANNGRVVYENLDFFPHSQAEKTIAHNGLRRTLYSRKDYFMFRKTYEQADLFYRSARGDRYDINSDLNKIGGSLDDDNEVELVASDIKRFDRSLNVIARYAIFQSVASREISWPNKTKLPELQHRKKMQLLCADDGSMLEELYKATIIDTNNRYSFWSSQLKNVANIPRVIQIINEQNKIIREPKR